MLNWLLNYFRKTKTYSTGRFILEMTAVAFIFKVLFIIFFGIIFTYLGISTQTDASVEQDFLNMLPPLALVLVILFASFETLTGQWLVIWLVGKFTKRIYVKLFASALVFALLHVEPMLMAAVFPIGVILAWSFLLYRRKSRWEAFWVTTAIHVLHNLFVLWLVWLSLSNH